MREKYSNQFNLVDVDMNVQRSKLGIRWSGAYSAPIISQSLVLSTVLRNKARGRADQSRAEQLSDILVVQYSRADRHRSLCHASPLLFVTTP